MVSTHMSAYTYPRRQFLQMAIAASAAPLLPNAAFASLLDEDRTAWYRDAKFGMFIHWGPYSLASVEASWPIMVPGKWNITEAEYVALHTRFNPIKYCLLY